MKGSDGGWNGGVGGRDDTLLSMGLLQIRIATYISRVWRRICAGLEEVSTGHCVQRWPAR